MSGWTIGFLGGGRAASILLGGLGRSDIRRRRVVVSDVDELTLARLKNRHRHIKTVLGGNAVAAGQDLVFVALHPPTLRKVLREVAGSVRPDAIVVSLAPGVTMAELRDMLAGFRRLARMIPNAAAIVGWGYNPIAFSYVVHEQEKASLRQALSTLGYCPEVPEDELEAYAVITAVAPTCLWPQFYELEVLAESFGLSPEAAHKALRRMVEGALAVMQQSGLSADEVMDLVPVRPLEGIARQVSEAYRTGLTELFHKLKP